jgi:hypothetical protein
MRAGPLSNAEVIALLNGHFVPVFVSNEDYTLLGPAPLDERAQRDRIWREASEAGLSSGSVHAYVLDPDGRVIDSLHVAEAARVERTREMLQKASERLRTTPGEPLIPSAPQSAPPNAAAGDVVLHLVARYLRKQEGQLAPLTAEANLGKTRNASWQAYPAENWMVLTRDESAALLPKEAAKVGQSWDIDSQMATKLLIHFYPSTECNDVEKNSIEHVELECTIQRIEQGVARAHLRGRLKMKHPFYPGRRDENVVETSLRGYLDFEPGTKTVRQLRLVTEDARYAGMHFGATLSSISP